jgi:histidine ammonia-lyase
MEATAASPSVVHPAVADAKPLGGQRGSADTIRGALEGGDLAAGLVETSVQAPLSFRVIPQVHGAVRGSLDAAERAVLVELNGRGDNPLVSIEHGAMIHNGNFDAVAMAIAFDQVRLALAHLGHLSERRMSHLWDAFFSGGPQAPPREAAGDPSGPPVLPAFFGISERYPAAASWAELRRLADPATLDVPPLDLGIEDVASNAPASVAATHDALALVEELLSIEVLMASDVLATRPSRRLGTGTAALFDRAREAIASLGDRATPVGAQRAVADATRPARRSLSAP